MDQSTVEKRECLTNSISPTEVPEEVLEAMDEFVPSPLREPPSSIPVRLEPAELLKLLKTEMSQLAVLWEEFEEKDLVNKEIDLRLTFPLKKVSSFVVIKQLSIGWKTGENAYSPWRLHLQLLAMEKEIAGKKGYELVTRIIWSQEGKFYHRMSSFLKPSALKMITFLGQCFGFSSNFVDDIVYPF